MASKREQLKKQRKKFFQGMGIPEKKEFVIDDFQREAIEYLIDGYDTLVVAPTGSGKTYIAVEAIQAILYSGGHAIYTTPLKALSNTKYTEFKARFEPDFSVGLLTGDRKIDTDADLVVATTEIFRNELYHYSERYSVVILDEIHFIADENRGPVWEESIILTPSSCTLVMLSASISNPEEIAEWIESVRGKECKIVLRKGRPVELRYGFMHPEYGIIPLYDPSGAISKEVLKFYGDAGLDKTNLRLKIPRRRKAHMRFGGRRWKKRR
ncbi:MAG: DEAD/DEAH box helicase [Candidatus Dadabacteria bacterium]|nr:MAG: DEAD/DEAH box helicase [Candidatus Dadabacteria bacterium]